MDSKEIIRTLNLTPHKEGGYFSEVYRSDEILKNENLPERYEGGRAISTSIYFLLEGEQKSHLHRLKSDETWHFYLGDPLKLYVIDSAGSIKEIVIGRDLENGQYLQYTIPRGCWFGAEVTNKAGFSLVGCTVAPGFDFKDFEMGTKADLLSRFPQHEPIINRLTLE